MTHRSLLVLLACAGSLLLGSAALARPVTTDDCLAKGLCAYVSPKGRVTCGKCPGQVRAVLLKSPNCVWQRGLFRWRFVCR